MFTLFTTLVGIECALVSVVFLGGYVVALVAFAIVAPMWGMPFLSLNVLGWVHGIKAFNRWLQAKYGAQEFPKEVTPRRNLPSALD